VEKGEYVEVGVGMGRGWREMVGVWECQEDGKCKKQKMEGPEN